jgi:hypothetical protein
MAKKDKYSREVELVDINDAQELAVKIIMQEGALRMQDLIRAKLDSGRACGDWAVSVIDDIDIEGIFDESEKTVKVQADVDHWVDDFGTVIHKVHKNGTCKQDYCTIHNPSDRAKAIGKQKWRLDRGMMERVCSHGTGHPDPDEFLYGKALAHACDGCCGKVV